MSAEAYPIVLTSVGRRCELADIFRRAVERLGMSPVIVGVDNSPMAPALHFCDVTELVPPVLDPDYPAAVARIVREHGARLVVPLIDTELGVHTASRSAIEAEGAVALISSAEVIDTTFDKYRTWRFFRDAGIPAPVAALPGDRATALLLPVVVKPRAGSSSKDVYVVASAEERDMRLATVPGAMAQQLALGRELTVDVLCDLDGRLLEAVVRERIATRGGESSIGVTVHHPEVWSWTARIVEALQPRGPITVQCFEDEDAGTILFTEVNARLGGGYPLADAAGADFAGRIVRMTLGERLEPSVGSYRAGLAMSRYDRSVFCPLPCGTGDPSSWSSDRAVRPRPQDV